MESLAGYGEKAQLVIEKETGMYKSHVSRALKELKDIKVAECTNPWDRSYKFYRLTSEGKKLLKKAEELKNSMSLKF